jgi:hypothetical protein
MRRGIIATDMQRSPAQSLTVHAREEINLLVARVACWTKGRPQGIPAIATASIYRPLGLVPQSSEYIGLALTMKHGVGLSNSLFGLRVGLFFSRPKAELYNSRMRLG